MPSVTLLGPQRFTPTLGEAVARAGVSGRLASVTAGWQEREAEDLELHDHLGQRTENLMLYARSEDVLERDAELESAYRERQERLRELQGIYRGRLGHALAALREVESRAGDPVWLEPERASALEALRALDEHHFGRIAAVHAAFEVELKPAERPSVVRHARQIDRQLERSEGVAIAGGHVAILLNRIRLFDIGRKIRGKAVFAWSAGAMVLAERVVVFHHFPPQGQGVTELLEAGLGLVKDIVPLPHARRRLALDDARRLSRLARRFAPAVCVTMSDGSWLMLTPAGGLTIGGTAPGSPVEDRSFLDGPWVGSGELARVLPDGALEAMPAQASGLGA